MPAFEKSGANERSWGHRSMDLLFVRARSLTEERVRALRERDTLIVPVGAMARPAMRELAASLGLAGAPAIVAGGPALQLPRSTLNVFACLNGPAWLADGDEAVLAFSEPLEEWSDKLENVRSWAKEAFTLDAAGREYSVCVSFRTETDSLTTKLEAYAARQDIRLTRIDDTWLLHARFGRTAAVRQIIDYHTQRDALVSVFCCGLGDLAPSDSTILSIEDFLSR